MDGLTIGVLVYTAIGYGWVSLICRAAKDVNVPAMYRRDACFIAESLKLKTSLIIGWPAFLMLAIIQKVLK